MSPTAAPSDLAVRYEHDAGRLQGLVARNIAAPPELIEEACQVAWGRLHALGGGEPRSAFGWLATTAQREALRLLRQREREVRLDDPETGAEVIALPARSAGPDRVSEFREQLAQIHRLPVRQQRMVWLQGFGYEYEEIAERTGDSRRTVERQLKRAHEHLRVLRSADEG